MRPLEVHYLARVEYEDGLRLQKLFGEARARELVPDTLLLLEHPAVLTLGRSGKRANIVATPEELMRKGVQVFETNRGGDVTFHGPGQIVGYPIFRLSPDRQDVRRYVRNLEESLLHTLSRFEIQGRRIPAWPGVWVGSPGATPEKIAAIGVHISRWQTSHGFALNVNTALSYFELIVACGIAEGGVTSMQRQLGREVSISEVERTLAGSIAEVFDGALRVGEPPARTVAVVILRRLGPREEVLLLQRTPERGGFWQIVTGRIEAGESPGQAAKREVMEETGLDLAVTDLEMPHSFALGEEVPPRLILETCFAARLDSDQPVRIDPREHVRFQWVDIAEAIRILPFEGLRTAVRTAQSRS